MADYQLDKVASEVNDTINGAVVSNASQSLSEAEKAQARENIGAVAFGSLLQLIGHYATLAELEAAVPSPNVGDPYSVGSVVPYDLYIFDGLTSDWLNYGPIRGTDISARSVQNYSIASGSWTYDDSLYEDYQYKARITISDITANDMPIVVFEPNDAVSGNFSPVCYCFAGYAEIWAKSVPNGSITLPTVTYLVNVGNGKGITNASGGINAGGISTDKLADGAVTAPKIAANAVSSEYTATLNTTWTGSSAPYSKEQTINGVLATDSPIIDLVPSSTYATAQQQEDAWAKVYRVVAAANKLTFYAHEKPSVSLPIKVICIRK